MTALILRQAGSRDFPQIREILRPWIARECALGDVEAVLAGTRGDRPCCTILESAGTVHAACVWQVEQSTEVAVAAFGATDDALESGAALRLLQEEILRWTDMRVSTATVRLPDGLSPLVSGIMRACGFLFEGVSCGCDASPRVTLAKHFLYRVIPQSEVMNFVKEFMISFGYDVQHDESGFRYRVREEFLLPFIFSPWHRITKSGNDMIMHPPARVVHPIELETLFYPLRIQSRGERPLLVSLDKKAAEELIGLPATVPQNHRQNSLFDDDAADMRIIRLNAVAYSQPAGTKTARRGLPVLFYVGRIGAVGVARVDDSRICNHEIPPQKPGTVESTADESSSDAAGHKPRAGKALEVRFQWYRPLRSPVPLEKIRALDAAFNPQRARSVTSSLYEAIVREGDRGS